MILARIVSTLPERSPRGYRAPMTTSLIEAIAAADLFARWGRFHLDNPRPEQLEHVTRELREALDRLEATKP